MAFLALDYDRKRQFCGAAATTSSEICRFCPSLNRLYQGSNLLGRRVLPGRSSAQLFDLLRLGRPHSVPLGLAADEVIGR
jgi:hypothetical protein